MAGAHEKLALGFIHIPYNWEYADETEREAATGFLETDLGKLSRQLDDNSIWMLVDTYPATVWVALGNPDAMTKTVYDADDNGIVDLAEVAAVAVIAEDLDIAGLAGIPSAPTSGDLVAIERAGVRYKADVDDLGGGGGGPTSAKYVVAASDGTLSAEIVIPGMAGSQDIAGAGGTGTSEEYDTSTTGLTWSPSSPTTVDSDTTIKSHLYILGQADTTERLGTKAWAPAGAFEVIVKGAAGTEHANTGGTFALHIGNSGNTVRLLIQLEFNAGGAGNKVQCYTYESGSYTARGTSVPIGVNEVYFKITRGASNDIKFYWSTCGKVWQWIGSHTLAITVANIGYRIAGNASGVQRIAVDFLRTDV